MKLRHLPAGLLSMFLLLLITNCKQKPPATKNENAWYKNQLIYNIDVKAFKDSDGNGEGDFNGLTAKLDYLKSIGVSMIWLAPFQPSPGKDDGYDITDYYGIDPRVGTLNDCKKFMAAAKKQGIHVIMDLVLNHTSLQHPWYKQASSDTTSAKHNWYVWSTERPKDWDKGMGFPGVEKETWTYDKTAKQYYFHRFYTFQPDLNFENPEVEKESQHVLAYWLDQGMEGFRLDAVPFIIDMPKTGSDKPEGDFEVLHRLSLFVKHHKPGALLLGEANVEPAENQKYFGEANNGLNMMFNFYANQFLFYGLASGEAKLFKKALIDTKAKPGTAQWAYFLRNHDEVDLGRLSKSQINEVYQKFGPDTNMQLYNRGIRRRLGTMLNNDPKHLHMAYSLLFSLPGTPVIRYGEEIGMGDDLNLKERLSVRTPMQWDSSMNGGFSAAKKTFRPMISAGEYGYPVINVATEEKDPQSLLNHIKALISQRKQCTEINNGEWEILDSGSDNLLVIKYNDKGKQLIVCHNFSNKPQEATVKLKEDSQYTLTSLMSSINKPLLPKIEGNKFKLKLEGYGYQWYRLR